MTTTPETASPLGQSVPRKEDARLVTGRTRWTDNLRPAGTLHMVFLRSPHAHARISGIDVSAAREHPGVVEVITGADVADEQGSLPCAWPVTSDIVHPNHPAMAVDEVRYVGEAVACVVARDTATATDALEMIDVDFEPLDAVVDMEAALADDAPLVHADAGTNRSYLWPMAAGDVDSAFTEAPVILERRYVQQRLIPAAMEPRSVVCEPDGDTFTLYSATQVPHIVRVMLAMSTGIAEHNIRVVAPDVGGGFGSKLQVTAEELLALLLARRMGQPVKWTETRSEGFQTTHHGRDQIQDIAIAADHDGSIRGLKVDLLADMGAYLMLVTPGVPVLGALMYPAIYKMDAYSFSCTGVFTTKMPTDAYRGAGRPEATYAIERIMDELAGELDMDPIQLRRRNWIDSSEFPYETIAGLTYDSGDYAAATDRALELFGYDNLRSEQRTRRAQADPSTDSALQLGIGVSTYTEMCGLAPSRVLGSLSYGAGGWEHASVRMLATGKVEVVTGTTPHGQGHVTSWSQIAADRLGVDVQDVRVLHGDTQVAPKGMDTYGSRSLTVGGVAVVQACERVVEKARPVAAHLLEAAEADLEFSGGAFRVRGTPEPSKSMAEVALATFTAHDLPEGVEPSLDAEATFDPENFSYPHGTHLCAVEVDTETGGVRIRSYVAVDDVGTVVNPQIVEGQLHGGIAQGIGQALYEEASYDPDGNLVTTTMADYLLPSAADLPDFMIDRTETPATSNPLGAKGVGEAGTIAATPAVVNAIVDALAPYGVHDIPMPCTPERVWRALHTARQQNGESQ